MKQEKQEHEFQEIIQRLRHELGGISCCVAATLDKLIQSEKPRSIKAQHLRELRALHRRAALIYQTAFWSYHTVNALKSESITNQRKHSPRLSTGEMMRYIIESAEDYHILCDGKNHILVDYNSFQNFTDIMISGHDFQIALGNLLDNAIKYSFPGTDISIDGYVGAQECSVRVTNDGIALPAEHLLQCDKKGWRSNEATQVAAGSGMGLWVTKSIMLMHGGSLRVHATDKLGNTNVELLFPIERIS